MQPRTGLRNHLFEPTSQRFLVPAHSGQTQSEISLCFCGSAARLRRQKAGFKKPWPPAAPPGQDDPEWPGPRCRNSCSWISRSRPGLLYNTVQAWDKKSPSEPASRRFLVLALGPDPERKFLMLCSSAAYLRPNRTCFKFDARPPSEIRDASSTHRLSCSIANGF